jgi:hypothetical protein
MLAPTVTLLLLLPVPATPADPYSPAWQEQQPAQPLVCTEGAKQGVARD